jgi:hypothetical protein
MRPFAVRLTDSPLATRAELAAIRVDATRPFAWFRIVYWKLRFLAGLLQLERYGHPMYDLVAASIVGHLLLEVSPVDQAAHLIANLERMRQAFNPFPRR